MAALTLENIQDRIISGSKTGSVSTKQLAEAFRGKVGRYPSQRELDGIINSFAGTGKLEASTVEGVLANFANIAIANEKEIRNAYSDVVGRAPTEEEFTKIYDDLEADSGAAIRPDILDRRLDRIQIDEEKTTAAKGGDVEDIISKYNLSVDEADRLRKNPTEVTPVGGSIGRPGDIPGGTAPRGGIQGILSDRKVKFADSYKKLVGADAPEDVVEYAANEGLGLFEFNLLVKSMPEYQKIQQDKAIAEQEEKATKQKGFREEARTKFLAEQKPLLEARAKEREAKASGILGPAGQQAELVRKQFTQGLDEEQSRATNTMVQAISRLQPYGGSALPNEISGIFQEGLKARGGLESDLGQSLLGLVEQDRQRREALGEGEKSLLDSVSFGGLESENLIDANQGQNILNQLYSASIGNLAGISGQQSSLAGQSFQERLARAQLSAQERLGAISNRYGIRNRITDRSLALNDRSYQEDILRRLLSGGGGGDNGVAGGLSGATSGATIGTSILPGWGTALGALAGGAAGYFGSRSR